jgi:hypothetical protein
MRSIAAAVLLIAVTVAASAAHAASPQSKFQSLVHPPGDRRIASTSLTVPSWNQLLAWLREMDLLRRAEAA